MKDGAPFGIAGIWENWREPASGEWIRTFAIITTDANELVADIHDRMPVILAPVDYARWLGEESDPRDLMRPFPAELMRMWPISTRVNKPEKTILQSSNRSKCQRMLRSHVSNRTIQAGTTVTAFRRVLQCAAAKFVKAEIFRSSLSSFSRLRHRLPGSIGSSVALPRVSHGPAGREVHVSAVNLPRRRFD